MLKNLYKGVKIKWFAIILGAVISIAGNLIIFAVYDEYMAIFYGTLESLAPLWKYLLVSMIQYFVMFATILSDLALVSVVTGVRRKMWRRMVRLPLKDFDEASPNGMLSRITSDAEYAAQPFMTAIAILQLIFSANALFAVCPTGLPTALPFAVVAIIAALATVILSIRVASRSAVYLQARISELTNHYAEQLSNIRFVKASNAEEAAIGRTEKLIDARYQAAVYGAFGKMLSALSGRFVHIVAYCACCLGGIVAIRHSRIDSTAPVQELYAYTTAMEVALTCLLTIPTTFATAIGGTKKLSSLMRGRGLDYNIGVRGARLSGGEQQRVAIARALLKDPEYLVLDEATANLDAKTEREVKEGLEQLMQGRTVIIIAHNYSAVSDADNIIVLKEGRIDDMGSREDVFARSSFLRSMQKV